MTPKKPKSKTEPTRLMTQTQYAEHRGVSRQYIGKLAKAGALLMQSGKIDADKSDLILDDKDPSDIGIAVDGEPKNLTEARFLKELYSARLRRLEFEEKSKLMIPAGVVTEVWTGAAGAMKNRLLAIPSKTAAHLASLTDPRAVREALTGAIEKALKGLAEDLRYGGR